MDKTILEKANIHLECDDGWAHLIEPLLVELIELGGKPLQIKEKFSGLRFYYSLPQAHPQAEAFDQKVKAAETKSYVTCEVCGASGVGRGGSWIKTLCDLHHEERQQEIARRHK